MPYHPKLSDKPITVLALWHGQTAEVLGQVLTFQCKANSDKVFLTTNADDPNVFSRELNRYLGGEVGYTNSPPNYSDFYQHVRRGPTANVLGQAEFTRDELVEVLASGNYYIG